MFYEQEKNLENLLKKSNDLRVIQKERMLKEKLNKAANEGVAFLKGKLYSDVNENSVKESYRITRLEISKAKNSNETCLELKSIVEEKLERLGFKGFWLSENVLGGRDNDYCFVDLHIGNKSE